MIAGPEKLIALIKGGNAGEKDGLSIVPEPNLNQIDVDGEASIDLHLGRWFLVFKQTRKTHFDFKSSDSDPDDKEYFVPFDGKFVIHPGRFVLATTLEWVRLPRHVAGFITGKSSIGRKGLIIETAAGVHPNFNGCLTLELGNIGEVPVSCYPGMKICQLFIQSVDGAGNTRESQFACQIKPTIGFIR